MKQQKPIALFFILSFLMMWNYTNAQNDSTQNMSILWSKVEAFIPTKVALPDNFDDNQSHNLVIGLHGYGSTAESFLEISEPFTDAGFIYAVPEAPYPIIRKDKTQGYEWFLYDLSHQDLLERPATDIEKAAMRLTTEQMVRRIIDDLRDKYRVDQIYIVGMSQGGIIAYLSGIHHAEDIDGMIKFGSVVDEDWLGHDLIEDGKLVRTLIIHGNKDKAVPIKYAEDNRDLLLKHGYNVTFKEFDGGHIVPIHLLGFVVDWINQK
jgi:phospholipase/carboxylesterase